MIMMQTAIVLLCGFILTCFSGKCGDADMSIVQIDLPDISVIGQLDEKLKSVLLRQFCADANWKVTEDGGAIIAQKCIVNMYCRTTQASPDAQSQLRIQVRFTPYTKLTFWDPLKIDIVSAADKKVGLRLKPSTGSSKQKGSSLVVKGSCGLFLTIDEWSMSAEREFTIEALKRISSEISKIVTLAPEITNNGFVKELSHSSSVKKITEPSLHVIQVPHEQQGIYNMYGYINEREAGYVTIHVLDATTLKELTPTTSLTRTTEYVGWSDSYEDKFFFCSELNIGSPTNQHENIDVIFKVIFHPTSTKEVVAKEMTISTWVK